MASTSAENRSPRVPFDDLDADIILRSSDNVDFCLYKVILAKSSPIFKTMFTLPHAHAQADTSVSLAPQVVELAEDAHTLEMVFRLIYPVENPTISSVDDLHSVMRVAKKYEMTTLMITNAHWIIEKFLLEDPLRVYSMAYILEFAYLAKEAAKRLLGVDDPDFYSPVSPPPEFSTLPALAIYQLVIYKRECTKAVAEVMENRDWILTGRHEYAQVDAATGDTRSRSSTWAWVSCTTCHDSPALGGEAALLVPNAEWGAVVYPRGWWSTYYTSLKDALAIRPTGGTIRSQFAKQGFGPRYYKDTSARSCNICGGLKAYTDLLRFNDMLAEKIDAEVAQVYLPLPFAQVGLRQSGEVLTFDDVENSSG